MEGEDKAESWTAALCMTSQSALMVAVEGMGICIPSGTCERISHVIDVFSAWCRQVNGVIVEVISVLSLGDDGGPGSPVSV